MEATGPKYTKRKPIFRKMKDIEPGRHCYNIYCKIISAETTENTNVNGEKYITVEGKVGDETGVANYLLRGDHAKNIKEGQVVALRNGRSNVVSDYIRLELDRFGKVSEENVTLDTVDETNDISAVAYVLQGRNNRRNRN